MKRKVERDEVNETNKSHTKAKTKKYDEAYVALGFAVTKVGDEERPVCLLCLKILAADSMKPNKLRCHLNTLHPNHADKPLEFFNRKRDEYSQQSSRFMKATSENQRALLASYKVAYQIAQCKKPHTIAEELILPAALDMVSVMLDDKSAAKIKTIPLSNDTVSRRINDIANDLQEQLIDKLKDKRFALQFDEATDSNKECLFVSYVRFDMTNSLCEDLLFCKYVRNRATAEELFKMLHYFLTENGLKWENCIGVCSDGAQTMAGMRKGVQALIKKASPNAKWTHCVIHRETLASRHLSSELSTVMTDIIGVVNFIKTRPLKTRVFSAICEEMGAEHQAVLFHSEARWLSRGKVLSRVFELREEIRMFLVQEHKYEVAIKFGDENFLAKLAYLSDIFGRLNRISSFKGKINTSLSSQYDWVRDPFNALAPTGFSSAEEDQFIDMTSDSTLRLRFTSQTLSEFWLSVEREYPLLGQKDMGILIPFATSYLCETGFSAVAALKTKYRSQLNIEQELRVAVSCFKPRFEKLCAAKRAHCSH
ncbi:hypothetical protein MHYP_G00147730 [Metynnis hypsauchen]